MHPLSRLLPWFVVLPCALWLVMKAAPPKVPAEQMQIHEFGRIIVAYQGREKPIDTVARNSLLIISDRRSFEDADEVVRPAIWWLLEVIAGADSPQHKFFRIENLDVQQMLGLKPRKGFRYAFEEFAANMPELAEQADRAHRREQSGETLDAFERQTLKTANAIQLYMSLANLASPHYIPPSADHPEWRTVEAAMMDASRTGMPDPQIGMLRDVLMAYGDGDAAKFNEAVARFRAASDSRVPETVEKAKFEIFFNQLQPFYHCAALYVVAFVLTCLAWFGWSTPLNRSAFWLISFTLVVHTLALVGRIYISGRPPVTNLYSSAVFIGWGCVGLGLVLELIYRLGVGNIIASVAGFITLVIAGFLSGDGDTFQVLQAVLDTQFWLATHVTCITFGYATTFVAGLLAIVYILRGYLTPSLSPEVGKKISSAIYGTICFATLFSFVGTVLGGLWADDSWGRFWGWDPKENGALIIVLWNVLVLHARWGGLVKQRGIAVLAVFGNVVVSWSWFGVNLLGVGLHTYGFMEGPAQWLGLFMISQVVIMAVGMLPLKSWRSPMTARR